MTDSDTQELNNRPRGCLAAGTGAAVLAILSPFVAAIRGWRAWRRGSDVRFTVRAIPVAGADGAERQRFELAMDVPTPAEPGFQRRLADTVIRVAEALRRGDDVYHLVYRLPWDEESTAIPVGPQIQELGERFSLVQSQGAMIGRTAVWLTLGGDLALAEVIDPVTFDPEIDGEPDAVLNRPEVRWAMATAWVRRGPSLDIRVVFVVPADSASRIADLLDKLA